MKTCYTIEKSNFFEFEKNYTSFKSQKIYNKKMEVIAEELLFNAGHLPADEILKSCKLFFSYPAYIDNLLIATKNRVLEAKLNRVFINIEQQTLCDQLSIAKFIELNETLKKYNCELVIEVTERMNCGHCTRLEEGVKTLKFFGVKLALDDYDLQPDKLPFGLEYFDIIKIVKPEKSNIYYFEDYLTNTQEMKCKEFVIENIEDSSELKQLFNSRLIEKNVAFQGYYLHIPESI